MAHAAHGRDLRVDAWLQALPKEHRDLCTSARKLLTQALPGAHEAIKWGFPVWVGQGNVVALSPYADHVNLQFYRGTRLADPDRLLEGTGKELRHVKVHHAKDLRSPGVKGLLRSAWRVDQEGA